MEPVSHPDNENENHDEAEEEEDQEGEEVPDDLEDPINDLSSSLRIITYTFSLLLLLTLLSNLYYLTFLNSFSRSLGMINNQYNISIEKIASIEKYQDSFYKPEVENAESNWKENRLSYPGVPKSRRIDNWGIYRYVKPTAPEDEEDEPAVLEKMGDKVAKANKDLFNIEKVKKLPLTKYFSINFNYPGAEKTDYCDGGVILAMRQTDNDDDFISTEEDFDNVARKM